MKALTICQPYAHMIIVTREKRAENRTWRTSYRGDVIIHAGKSRAWLGKSRFLVATHYEDRRLVETTDIKGCQIHFGAAIGIAKIIDCLHIEDIAEGTHDEQYPWLREHVHLEGPWCWVLGEEVIKFIDPIPMKGKLGLFNVTAQELRYDK